MGPQAQHCSRVRREVTFGDGRAADRCLLGDPLLVERALARALTAWGQARRVVLFGDEPCLDRLIEELGSADLFGERRAIVVRRADPLMGEERLGRALARGVPPDLGVAFVGAALRGPVVQAAEEATSFATPTGRALRALASELLSEAGLAGTAAVVDPLIEAAGGDTLLLSQEVEKLSLWKGNGSPRGGGSSSSPLRGQRTRTSTPWGRGRSPLPWPSYGVSSPRVGTRPLSSSPSSVTCGRSSLPSPRARTDASQPARPGSPGGGSTRPAVGGGKARRAPCLASGARPPDQDRPDLP